MAKQTIRRSDAVAEKLSVPVVGKDAIPGDVAVSPITLNRKEIIALGEKQTTANLVSLLAVIGSDPSENNRESAIKCLGKFGGLRVVDILEGICSLGDSARFAKGAATNALEELGLSKERAPLLDPLKLHDSFLRIVTTQCRSSAPQRRDRNTAIFSNLLAAQNSILWSPEQALGGIRLDIRGSVNFADVAKTAIKHGLSVDTVGNSNMVTVSGTKWPGFSPRSPELSLTLMVGVSEGNTPTYSIFTSEIASQFEAASWDVAIRMLVRYSRFLGAE